MKSKRTLSLILITCLALSALLMTGCGSKGKSLLALGDSITVGFALKDPENECYVDILAKSEKLNLVNAAANGAKSGEIKDLVCGGKLDDSIVSADYIVLTMGGNDLSKVLYESVGERLTAAEGAEVTWQDVKQRLLDGKTETMTVLGEVIKAVNSTEDTPEKAFFNETLVQFEENLKSICQYIKEKNSDAQLLVYTYYNPFKWVTMNILKDIVSGMDESIKVVNAIITKNSDSFGYFVADAYTAFDGSNERLSNAYTNSFIDMNMDIHPNAAGHAVLAQLAQEQLFPEK